MLTIRELPSAQRQVWKALLINIFADQIEKYKPILKD
jgi:hypothetical protein